MRVSVGTTDVTFRAQVAHFRFPLLSGLPAEMGSSRYLLAKRALVSVLLALAPAYGLML